VIDQDQLIVALDGAYDRAVDGIPRVFHDTRSDPVRALVYAGMCGDAGKDLLENAGIQLGAKTQHAAQALQIGALEIERAAQSVYANNYVPPPAPAPVHDGAWINQFCSHAATE
jgi:hypothetical protein